MRKCLIPLLLAALLLGGCTMPELPPLPWTLPEPLPPELLPWLLPAGIRRRMLQGSLPQERPPS